MVQNLESNSRFHTDWLNMIYPRLRLAKDLLTDDNEQANISKICDEILALKIEWVLLFKTSKIQRMIV